MDRAAAGDEHPFLRRLLGALPGGVFVIDGMGTISYASDVAASMVGRAAEDVVGSSVLSYVSEQTAWMYAAAIALADDYKDVLVGPLRVTLVTADGDERHADLWAANHLEDPEVGGVVCLLTEETAAVWLGQAVEAMANGADLPTIAGHVVTAMRGHPVTADAVLLDCSGGSVVTYGDTQVPAELRTGADGPWREATAGQRTLHATLDDVPAGMRSAAEAAGYHAVWAEPVATGEPGVWLALVVWRRHTGNPSPNELNTVFQGASIVSLAWRAAAT